MIAGTEFDGQFIVSNGHAPERPGSRRIKLNSLCVDIFARQPVTKVFDRSGELIGCLLGTPIDVEQGKILVDHHVIEIEFGKESALNIAVETEIYRFAGSFVFLLDMPHARRLYLDANGTKSVVYNVADQVAASTTLLVLPTVKEYYEGLDRSLYAALNVDKDGWFPAGLTAHAGVKRLISNHYLDLETWTCVRHWPLEPVVREADPAGSIKTIVEQTSRVIETLSKVAPTNLALTAGYDTRLLLACSRNLLDQLGFITVNVPGGELDIKRARELSERFGLRHQLLPYVEASPEQMETWQRKVSHCITGSNLRMHPSMAPLKDTIFVGGVGGEVGRGFLWLNSNDQTKLDANGLIERLKLPLEPRLRLAVDAWLRPLKDLDSLLILDLAFMELRVSSWAFAQAYAPSHHIEINPLISRKTYKAMLSLQPSVRRNNGMVVRAVTTAWPELLELPVNRYGDWRDAYQKARDAAADPRRALRKLRQLASAKTTNVFSHRKKSPGI
ncbi:hypothetical protein SAMN04488498_103305 [Mesorhizobium albiziae]|uniref:Asparagine synthase (Glutamine-hydrolysing) n=1 Tax=Neomesorhizobium albiziae TaxID=335020 RepID=A0A1I3XKC0_9HYPH|nr:hypothetical protein [Mesorhizobium albiziae]GLS30382.1 hypothetical protein GCM10007937_20900 [Mesorhizobium albiziae]SFK19799.1 hypothetical protein SAMN04488498_103305 [Mesorhizobium albiziae]